MKDFFKDYFFSFFKHEYSKNIFKRSFFITFINTIIVFLSLIFSLFIGDQISFEYSYNHSSNFQNALSEILTEDFSTTNNEIKLNFEYNSYKDDSKKLNEKYNYQVIVDTREKSTTFENFSLLMKSESSLEEITYQNYLVLSEESKSEYSAVITHTGNYLNTLDNVSLYETFLNSLEDKSSFSALQSKYISGLLSDQEYANQLYILYGKSYYPEDVYDSDSYGEMPTMHSYYRYCLNNDYEDNDFILIYNDGIEASFKASGKQVSYLGFYSSASTYKVSQNAEKALKDFVLDTFNGGNEYRFISNLLISFYAWFTLIIIFIIETVIFRSVLRSINPNAKVYFLKLLNLEGSYMLFSSFVNFVFTLIASFFMFKLTLVLSSCALFLMIVLIRTIIFFIKEKNFDDSVPENL